MARQTLEQQLAAAELKANRLRHQLSTARRKADTRRKVVIGGMVLAVMEGDGKFRARILDLLRQNVTRPADIETIADLLADDPQQPHKASETDPALQAAE